MTTTNKSRSLVVIQLAGANDPLNTIIPYTDGLYYDFRPNVGIPTDQVLPIDGKLAFNPTWPPSRPCGTKAKSLS